LYIVSYFAPDKDTWLRYIEVSLYIVVTYVINPDPYSTTPVDGSSGGRDSAAGNIFHKRSH
jgi:hypothetical protein